jgi:hypothetical protein
MNEETDSVAKKADIIKEILKAIEGEDTVQREYKSIIEKANNPEKSQRIYDI